MRAEDFMTKSVVTINQNQTVAEAALVMVKNQFSVLPVVNDQQKLVGIITESDFVGKEANIPHAVASIKQLFSEIFNFGNIEDIYRRARNRPISEVMTRDPQYVAPTTPLTDIVNLMIDRNVKRLPVVHEGKIVGIITRKDLLRAFNLVAATEAA